MSVLIKGMEMPKSCEKCPFIDYEEGFCFASYEQKLRPGGIKDGRHEDCPLVPVQPHGRLIDEKEIQQLLAEMIPVAREIINSKAIIEWVAENIQQCSTIIPAEEAQDG